MFDCVLPLEVQQRIFSLVAGSSFSPHAQVLPNSEIPICVRQLCELENTSARADIAFECALQGRILATLCRVCHSFNRAFQPMLYSCVVIQWTDKARLLNATLKANPDIACMVRSIVVMPAEVFVAPRVITRIIRRCAQLSAFQDYTDWPRRGLRGCIGLPAGIRLNKICAGPYVIRNFSAMPVLGSTLTSLEVIAAEGSSFEPALSLPALESLKIAIDDCTMHGCLLPSLRYLYIEGSYHVVCQETAVSALSFFRSCGKGVTRLFFGKTAVYDGDIALESVFPSLENLFFSADRRVEWVVPAPGAPFFDLGLGHSQIVTIGLYGIVGRVSASCIPASDSDGWLGVNYDGLDIDVARHFGSLNRASYPLLGTIRNMEPNRSFASLTRPQMSFWEGIVMEWGRDGILFDA